MKDKREQIIEAAFHLFSEKGFEGTSVRDIAEKASVNVAMVNYYFGTKEKLFEKIIEFKSASTRGLLDEIAHDNSLTAIKKIEAVVDSYVEKLFTNRTFHRLIQQELILNQREDLQCSIVNHFVPNSIIIKNIIETGIKKGEFKKIDVDLTLVTIFGVIHQVLNSRKFCNRLMNKPDNYVPYEDVKFKKRVATYLKQLMHVHLLNN